MELIRLQAVAKKAATLKPYTPKKNVLAEINKKLPISEN